MVSNVVTNDFERVSFSNKSKFQKKSFNEDKNIFASNPFFNTDYSYNEFEIFYNNDYKTPREEYDQFKSEQGIISEIINNIVNNICLFSKIGIKGSKEIEKIILEHENGKISEFDALEAVSNYKKSLKKIKQFILNIITIIMLCFTFSLCKICGANIMISLSITCMITGGLRNLLDKIEDKTKKSNKIKKSVPLYNYSLSRLFLYP